MSATASSLTDRPRRTRGIGAKHLRLLPSREAQLLWLAVVIFVLVSLWWLTQDDRVPDYDSGFHMLTAATYHFYLTQGQDTAWFTTFNTYPPLVHLLGAASIFVFGVHPMAMIMSSNVVFVPMLAFGCYGTGRIVAGPRAGLLAGLFALGTPMFVSMMHEYDLDPPEAALVAMTVWAVLASRRFERAGVSALAGLLFGLALMTKETAVLFVGGLVLVSVIRGGWRSPLGLLAFLVPVAAVAGPWYAYHLADLKQTFTSIGGLVANAVQAPPRFSMANLGWYFWNLVNVQTLAIFAALFFIGSGIAVWRCRRPLAPENVLPELLVGAFVGWLGMTYLTHKDPRYTLPYLVYVAVLGTYWIVTLRSPLFRRALTGMVVVLAAIYFTGMSVGLGGTVRVALPGARPTIIYPRQFTLYETAGWVRGGPQTDGHVLALLKWLYAAGVRGAYVDVGPNPLDFNLAGLDALMTTANIYPSPVPLPSDPRYAYIFLHTRRPGDPPPCQTLNDGLGVYVARGNTSGLDPATLTNPADPSQPYVLVCPGRHALTYRRHR